jgi:SAM-dependent methyltransferase
MQQDNTVTKYVHREEHNLQSPNAIVPFLMEKFHPSSVIDVGCGIGTFLKVFKQHGVSDILGVDGTWVNKEQLYIDKKEFVEADLEKPIKLDRTFDLVLCLEVAEHLSPGAADTIVGSLTSLGKVIVFSAATVKQGGQNHINEQEFSYWKKKFEEKGYKIVDFFRPHFWNVERIQWWYKQNMFLVLHESIDANTFEAARDVFLDNNVLIHPDLYYERIEELEKKTLALEKFGAGEGGNFNLYLKLLYRSFRKSLRK